MTHSRRSLSTNKFSFRLNLKLLPKATMNPTIVIVVLATTLLSELVNGIDYCHTGLCKAPYKHIGCKATENFGLNCTSERSLVPMTVELKAYLLKKHNVARSDIANGKISGYKSANRMVEMVRETAKCYCSELNVKWNFFHCVVMGRRTRQTSRVQCQNVYLWPWWMSQHSQLQICWPEHCHRHDHSEVLWNH